MNKPPKLFKYLWLHKLELISAILMIVGIILSFFFFHIGGALVGLGFGLCFYAEIHEFFLRSCGYRSGEGLFKSVMLALTLLYLLIAATTFVIAAVIGFLICAVVLSLK